MQLGVNVDHVATLRNLRGTPYPSVVEIAQIAVTNGADFITVHLREDRRHVQDKDLDDLCVAISAPINLEIAATAEMFTVAKRIKPYSICLVPEKREEVTTESGLDVASIESKVPIIRDLQRQGTKVTLFIEPNIDTITRAKAMGADKVELHVGEYCRLRTETELEKIVQAAKICHSQGIECHAGHGIDYVSAERISHVPYITAINVGHFLVCHALYHGIGPAIQKMKAIITHKNA